MGGGDPRIGAAGWVCEPRIPPRHFRIVLPGWSDNAISPAIFSRSGNCMEHATIRALYKRVEGAIGGWRTRAKPSSLNKRRMLRLGWRDRDETRGANYARRSSPSAFWAAY